MSIALYDISLPTLAENLALDEALLLAAEEQTGTEALRFWEWPFPGVVLGAGRRLTDDVNEDNCRRDGVPIQRRASGGGTVLLGRGCLLFSLVLRFDRDSSLRFVNASYEFILSRIVKALEPLVQSQRMGISDLAVAGQKFAGNAQQRKRDHVLHHGTLLYGFDLSALSRYLLTPDNQPAYRLNRPHESFVTNLPCESAQLRQLMIDEWKPDQRGSAIPMERVAELVAQKYARPEWVRRR